MNRRMLLMCLISIGVAAVLPVFAGAPLRIATVAPVSELVAEAEAKIAALEAGLDSTNSYSQGKEALAGDAGILAVLAQAVAEHDGRAAWKKSAADMRDAAIALSNAKNFGDAKRSLDAVRRAQKGQTGNAKADADWAKLAKLKAVMVELGKRSGSLVRAAKKVPANADEAIRDASVMAVLAVVAHANTHEVQSGQPADIALWQGWCKDLQKNATTAADSLRKKDEAVFKKTFTALAKSCGECHKRFRKEE